ncbi:hypothetical protein A2483_00350 [Candidatus Peregrinibacteria bacterium RIFOXYC2_FULL_33_13]|nr:MAG: hypothetical protein UR27_C0019G0010 [Candidatus Peregrinibacteria bacterium GW2011_GWA2_33_10]KKP39928.1 MAG: hypothetical protein UR30_C0007G0029 [Candidatus Peregrinibacteria bacterium GW2011_GWC2_33_13]OGJ47402.1 MAG: hypothetical protein A2229_02800 [Candidatus Peregrinibacteria bacterium RIFOXYA2_FULL_33_7]OGJ53530.1 MAG: hypothetical protein A2483_00350 [Candidatus Peregrinibacteria bacterium RIFOXYC2_FULL_33_13]
MKKLAITLILTLILGTPAFAITKPQEPIISDATKESAKNLIEPVQQNTFEGRKALLITASNTALIAMRNIESRINDSKNLTNDQKKELSTITNNTEEQLNNYKNDVSNAKTSEELTKANQEMVQYIKDHKEEIRAAAAKATMIGIEGTMQATQDYIETANDISDALKVCGSDTTTLDNYITAAEDDLEELENLYNEIMQDEKVDQSESTKVREASRQAAKLSTDLATITSEIALASETCPQAQKYVETLKRLENL